MINSTNNKHKAFAVKRVAALITVVLLLAAALVFTGCKQPAGSSSGDSSGGATTGPGGGGTGPGGGGTGPGGGGATGPGEGGGFPPAPGFTPVSFGTNGADLKTYLTNTASPTEINRIEVTGVPSAALAGTATEAGVLGKIIKESGKMVALKLPAQSPPPSLKNGFKDCTNLQSVQLEYVYEAGKFDGAFAGCTGLGKGSILVPLEQLHAYQTAAASMGVALADRFIPSSIEGVWRWVSEKNEGQPLRIFPQDTGLGSQMQPYYCFDHGKVYYALKGSGYPSQYAQHNGIFKMPGDWGIPYIYMVMSFNITFNGTELTWEQPGRVILKMEKVTDPTVEQILAAQPYPAQGGGSGGGTGDSRRAVLTLSPDKRDIKIRALTTESGSSPITVEGCTETALSNYGDTVLHATGTTVILKGNIIALFCAGDTFDRNKLTALNVQGLPDLRVLDCRNNNLTSLDVHGLTSLKNLDCAGNIELSVLNIQGAAALEELSFGGKITTLNLQGLTALRILRISGELTTLDVQGLLALQSLNCSYSKLTTLDVQGLPALRTLVCNYSELTTLDVQGLPALQSLECSHNKLTTLDVQGLPALQYLDCSNNQLNAEAMRTLLTGLPQRQESDSAWCVLYNDDPDEGNHKDFTSASADPALKQAFNKAKIEKHWRMYKRIGNKNEEI